MAVVYEGLDGAHVETGSTDVAIMCPECKWYWSATKLMLRTNWMGNDLPGLVWRLHKEKCPAPVPGPVTADPRATLKTPHECQPAAPTTVTINVPTSFTTDRGTFQSAILAALERADKDGKVLAAKRQLARHLFSGEETEPTPETNGEAREREVAANYGLPVSAVSSPCQLFGVDLYTYSFGPPSCGYDPAGMLLVAQGPNERSPAIEARGTLCDYCGLIYGNHPEVDRTSTRVIVALCGDRRAAYEPAKEEA